MSTANPSQVKEAKQKLDAHVREIIEWHFNPATGSPFWVDAAAGRNPLLKLGFDPRKEVKSFDDLNKFGLFEDEWLRGGPVRRCILERCGHSPHRDQRERTLSTMAAFIRELYEM